MNENKMETMPVNKLLITMAAPMVLSMLIGALYNVVDTVNISICTIRGNVFTWCDGITHTWV